MSCACQRSGGATMGALDDWFPPARWVHELGQWIEGQRAAAGDQAAGGLRQGAGDAAATFGPYVLASAVVVSAAVVSLALVKGRRR